MNLGLVLIIIAILFIYLALVRPQRRKQSAQAQMWDELEEGDEVVTAGGIYGTIVGFQEDDLLVEIAPNLQVRVARRAIAGILPAEDDDEALDEDDEPDGLDPAASTAEESESYPGSQR
jgi:preprotein translocase subunit YajC